MRRAALVGLLSLVCAPAAAAPSVLLRNEVGPKEIHIGDRVTSQITVQYSTALAPAPLTLAPTLGDFEVTGVVSGTPERFKDDRFSIVHRVTLTTFSTGTVTLPAIPLQFQAPDGTVSQATTEPVSIAVKSLLEEKGDEGNLRPIKGPYNIRSYRWIAWTLGVLAFLALAIWGYRRWKRATAPPAPAVPARPPEELAWEALHALEDANLLESGEVKEFYIRLTGIFREYLEGRYGLSAMDRTSSELVAEIRRLNLNFDVTNESRSFLENADLVKFAKLLPERTEIEGDLNRVKQFVNGTTPAKMTPPATGPEVPTL